MKQLVQNLKTGELKVIEVPAPLVRPGGLLVRNVSSVISLGTEKLLMDFAQKSLPAKALARPDLAREVLNAVRQQGLLETYREVMNRLDRFVPLGYSSAGVVMEVGEGVEGFQVGDRVACMRGDYASHAEFIFVPKNLCARVPDGVDFESAAFGALGAIALHSVRSCELTIGESVAIIGLGLIGLLAVQIAKAGGYRVLGIDINPQKVALATQLGADQCAVAGRDDVVGVSRSFSRGSGLDAVIVLASAKTSQPLETAAEIAREKAKVVIPGLGGLAKLEIPRDPFYRKELSLVVPRFAGAGVYNTEFEVKGADYPSPYVRWTETRNLEEFLALMGAGKVTVQPFASHRFRLEEAEEAYKAVTGDTTGKYVGVLLAYGQEPEARSTVVIRESRREARGRVTVGVIGAGNFALTVILPILSKLSYVNLKGVATATGVSGRGAADKFGFQYCTTDYRQVLEDRDVDCVFIATRHNLHARLAAEALRRGKDVFVEKPLALTLGELREVGRAYSAGGGRLMVGFNRRFSPLTVKAREFLQGAKEPFTILYRVNAGPVPRESWVHDPSEGGGRLLGEVCHFIDFAQFIAGSPPQRVYAEALNAPGVCDPDENVLVTVSFANGSVASIIYAVGGDKAFPRERVEVFGGGSVCLIDNFHSVSFWRRGRRRGASVWGRNMGHKEEMEAFLLAVKEGKESPLGFEACAYSTLATILARDSLLRKQPLAVSLGLLGGE